MVLPRPPEMTPEKEPALRACPRGLPDILPRGFVSMVEFVVVAAVTHGVHLALLTLLAAMAWLHHHGYWYANAAVVVAYLPTYFNGASDKVMPSHGGLHWDGLRTHSLWHIVLRHFRLACIRVCPLNPTDRYIFALHQSQASYAASGVLCGGMWETLFPHHPTRALAPPHYFYVPILRELLLWLGCIEATESVAHEALHNGLSFLHRADRIDVERSSDTVANEGMALVVDPEPPHSLALIRVAMMHGVSLVPVLALDTAQVDPSNQFVPDANDVNATQLRNLVVEAISNWVMMSPPCKASFVVVFGSPMHVERNARPSLEEELEVHAIYTQHLRDLFAACHHDLGRHTSI